MVTKAAVHAPWSWGLIRGPVRRFFDSLAPGWDQRVGADSEARLAPIGAALEHVERIPRRALDIGTGTGAAALELTRRYPDAEVLGIDISEPMIARAREKAAEQGSGARFEVADIAAYKDQAPFDLVLMMNMPPFFRPVSDLVAPGGYVVSISSRGPTTPFYTSPRTLERKFGGYGFRTLAAGSHGPATYHVAEKPA